MKTFLSFFLLIFFSAVVTAQQSLPAEENALSFLAQKGITNSDGEAPEILHRIRFNHDNQPTLMADWSPSMDVIVSFFFDPETGEYEDIEVIIMLGCGTFSNKEEENATINESIEEEKRLIAFLKAELVKNKPVNISKFWQQH